MAAAPVLLRHDASLAHEVPGHPERPARLHAVARELARHDWLGHEVREAPAAEREDLLRAHPEAHIAGLEALQARGGGAIDGDTSVVVGTLDAALHGAGGACALVDALLGEGVPGGASLLRPPGHHAEPDHAMGFCYFGSIAIAARRAQAVHGVERVLVVDWDVHHGNGTQAILWDDPTVLFASIHQMPLYPGTGSPGERGGPGAEGATVNLPVPAGTGDDGFASLVRDVCVPLGRAFAPQLVLVSAGFDAHRDDPLAGCRVTEAGFTAMAADLRALAAELGVPLGLVLEGGYDLDALARSVTATLPVSSGAAAAPGYEGPVHPLAERAREAFGVTP